MPHNSAGGKRHVGGFTAIELMTVLVLVGIIASLAVPSMSNYLARMGTRRALDEFVADVSYARLLAVRNGRPAAVRIQGGGRYTLEIMADDGTWSVQRTISLQEEYPGVSFAAGPGAIEFSSRGLVTSFGGEQFVKMSGNGVRDSVFVSPAGRVYRDY